MLKTLLASLLALLLATTAAAQAPTFKEDGGDIVASHPYIRPDLNDAAVIHVQQLAPVTLDEWKPALKQDLDKPFYALSLLYVAGTVADIVTTKKAIARGGVESNQLFARNGGKDIALGLNIAVSAIPLGVAYLLQRLGAKWPARVLLSVAAGFKWNAAIHNHGILRD